MYRIYELSSRQALHLLIVMLVQRWQRLVSLPHEPTAEPPWQPGPDLIRGVATGRHREHKVQLLQSTFLRLRYDEEDDAAGQDVERSVETEGSGRRDLGQQRREG